MPLVKVLIDIQFVAEDNGCMEKGTSESLPSLVGLNSMEGAAHLQDVEMSLARQ